MVHREVIEFFDVLYHIPAWKLSQIVRKIALSLYFKSAEWRVCLNSSSGHRGGNDLADGAKGCREPTGPRTVIQLSDAPLDANHSLAAAAKLVPHGVICLISALAFHELTDRIPASVWVAIGPRDWRPKITRPRIQIERFGPKVFDRGIETHEIERVQVRIYSPAKTIVDLFGGIDESQKLYDLATGRIQVAQGMKEAVQGMKEGLRLRKATPAEIARYAIEAGIWEKVVQPRLEALIVNA